MKPPTEYHPKFSKALIDFRASIQAHADAIGEIVEIDYRMPTGKPIAMRFQPAAVKPPAAKLSQAVNPKTRAERRALKSCTWGLLAEALRQMAPEDLAEHLQRFPTDRILLKPR